MERVGIRELRNDTSAVVRRAQAGARIIVTVDGVPAAQITPLDPQAERPDVAALIAAGLLLPPASRALPAPARPVRAPRSTSDVLDDLRDR